MPTIACHTLGCKVNQYDTQAMLELFLQRGYTPGSMEEEADVYLLNTCTVTGTGDKKSLQMARRLKRLHPGSRLILCGCLAQKSGDSLLSRTGADLILGTQRRAEVVDLLEQVLSDGKPRCAVEPLAQGVPFESLRISYQEEHTRASLKIQEGCDNHCTYCIIPKIRGNFRSVPMEVLIKEAKELVANGVKELILVAQETTVYGKDLYGKKTLPKLLDALNEISGLVWIRILYCYPEEIDDELIAAIKRNTKVCHYLDIPIQHASDEILRRMGRRTSRQELEDIVALLRREIPDICLRTTIISGFPGETQEHHEDVWHFVNDTEFDRLGVFTYSCEEDTPAALMENQVPQEIKEIRRTELMELQQEIAFEKAEDRIGDRFLVMIEGSLPEDGVYIGRTYMDAPNVDGYIFVKTEKALMTGDFIDVVVTEANEYDLIGEPEDEYCK